MSQPQEEHLDTCAICSATIYPEHIARGVAGLHEGRLLCHICLGEHTQKEAPDEPAPSASLAQVDFSAPSTKIRSFGAGSRSVGTSTENFRRPLQPDSVHATRCKTFHAKLSDASFSHLDEQINEWADAHDDVHIKFAVSTIGVVEGKNRDSHIIVTVFY